ncbi:MAG: hypothetical protein HOM21_11265, partial [Halobacteriovoraceae bacterium]|nr:hypothetical protein [Halobacteriovoraceae bacterium]
MKIGHFSLLILSLLTLNSCGDQGSSGAIGDSIATKVVPPIDNQLEEADLADKVLGEIAAPDDVAPEVIAEEEPKKEEVEEEVIAEEEPKKEEVEE